MSNDALVFLVALTVVFLACAWAGWHVAARRERKPPVMPDRVWLCDACRSFNDPTHLTCYRCHRPRPVEAREVVPDPEFRVDQQLGSQRTSTQLGASRPWLAGEEPLRDAWLAGRAEATEPAPTDPTPAGGDLIAPDHPGTDRGGPDDPGTDPPHEGS